MNRKTQIPPAQALRALLETGDLLVTPACWDALSAKLIQQAGFPLTFMSGFAVAAARLGLPDTGLISFAEMADQLRNITACVSIPVIGDGDTGYGNALNVRRTVQTYAQAGAACVMIEDQIAPKRCGHTKGKQVTSRDEAFARIRAAVDARNEGADIVILARTDARQDHGLDEAIARARGFREIGADITFVEAPHNTEEMQQICAQVDGPCMANLVEGGLTPMLSHEALQKIGYAIAIYPLAGLTASIGAVNTVLGDIRAGALKPPGVSFAELRRIVGFDDYYEAEERYRQGPLRPAPGP